MRARQWRHGLIIGALILIVVWLMSLIWGLAGKARIAVDEAGKAQRRYQALEERRTMLEANLEAVATPLGQDAAIRTAFGVARPGETVIIVVPPESVVATTTASWWQKILSWF